MSNDSEARRVVAGVGSGDADLQNRRYPREPIAVDHFDALQRVLRVSFRDQGLLRQALVHRSYLNEHPDLALESNERLEFLGDAFIGLAVAQELYTLFPDSPEGQLTILRSALVRGETLAGLAEGLSLGDYLTLGTGEEASGGRERKSNLAAVFEAVVGAVLLDRGHASARRFTLRCLRPQLRRLTQEGVTPDPKSRLQEVSQARGMGTPAYRTVTSDGPDHARLFRAEVEVAGLVVGVGEGRRKVDAERAAARQALESTALTPSD